MTNKYASLMIAKKVALINIAYSVILLVSFIGLANILSQAKKPLPTKKILNFEECAAAGNAILESYPRGCLTESGQQFVENVGNELEKFDMIRILSPRPNAEIVSPLRVEGEARGNWFFEASFPLVLTNWDGLIIAEGFASAEEDWMTENFVKFRGELSFSTPDFGERGFLILRKDNPSGLPEHDDALEIPVRFKK